MSTPSAMEPQIIRRENFLVMGTMTRIQPGTESAEEFGAIWRGFEVYRELIRPLSADQMYYGVSFPASEEGQIEYIAGMAITPGQTIPAGLVVRDVPAATYAVFECPTAAIGQTYGYIFGKWRSSATSQIDHLAPAFENYPPESDAAALVRIHIPIQMGKTE